MSLVSELLTVRDWLRWSVSRFGAEGLVFGHGTSNAWDEAAYLVLHTLHLPLDRLEPFLDARLTVAERQRIESVIARRAEERIPAAYITGEAWLGDFRFFVDERVIVPRSFIASILREGALEPWLPDADAVQTALDLCTGSGCLAILAAHYFGNADVDAADVSADALAVAHRNVAEHGLLSRVNLVRSDLFANLEGKRYDLIVSNPPYVNAAGMAELPPEYRHEPALALAGGDDGLDAVRRIVAGADEHLEDRGVLVVEVGHNRDVVEAALPALPFTWLEIDGSDDAVFLLTREDLARASADATGHRPSTTE